MSSRNGSCIAQNFASFNTKRSDNLKRNIVGSVALGAVGLLLLAGCAGGTEESSSGLTGQVLADGSSTVGPFSETAAEFFMEENRGVRVTVGISGTGGGFEKFCAGETDLSGASRLIKDEEAERCAESGIAYDVITVANDALAVVVNKDNPLQCLTTEQVSEIWQAGSTVKTWGETSADVPADFRSTAMTLYGPGTDSGTFDLFTEEINGEAGNIRTDYNNIGEDDNAAVVGVAGDAGAIAFIPYSFFMENLDNVKGLEIDNGDGCYAPTLDNVIDGVYTPLGRALYWYGSDAALQRPEVLAFFEFAVNDNERLTEAAGFIGLTPPQKEANLSKIAVLAG